MNNYFTKLLLDTRYGVRIGFPLEDAERINTLFTIHKDEFPWLINVEVGC